MSTVTARAQPTRDVEFNAMPTPKQLEALRDLGVRKASFDPKGKVILEIEFWPPDHSPSPARAEFAAAPEELPAQSPELFTLADILKGGADETKPAGPLERMLKRSQGMKA